MSKSRDPTTELRVKEALEFLQMHPFSIPRARLLRLLDGIPPRAGIPAADTKPSKPDSVGIRRFRSKVVGHSKKKKKKFMRCLVIRSNA
jgi:hypothetical protein